APCAPIFRSSARLNSTDRIDFLSITQTVSKSSNQIRCADILQLLANQHFLSIEFRRNEFAGDAHRRSVNECQGLCSAESRFAWRCWSGYNSNFAETIQHHE